LSFLRSSRSCARHHGDRASSLVVSLGGTGNRTSARRRDPESRGLHDLLLDLGGAARGQVTSARLACLS